MSTCTWSLCTEFAEYPQIAMDGEVWANLCGPHNAKLDEVLKSGDPKQIIAAWAKAHGDAKRFAKRMMRHR